MSFRTDYIAAIEAALNAITIPEKEDGGSEIIASLVAAINAAHIAYPNHLTDSGHATSYSNAIQAALGVAVTQLFESNDWRTAFIDALADGAEVLTGGVAIPPTAVSNWSSVTTYGYNRLVVYGGVLYISIQSGNLNKVPFTEPTWWSNTILVDGAERPLTYEMMFSYMFELERNRYS